MGISIAGLSTETILIVALITLIAGFVKGAVGFAMPMIMISGVSSFIAPEIALAALILPTLVTNIWQALRGGLVTTVLAVQKHWRYLAAVIIVMMFSAQLVRHMSAEVFLFLLGLLVSAFVTLQLLGIKPRFQPAHRRPVEIIIGVFTGLIGGISGVWGPLTVTYLTMLETPKAEQMRIQGAIYGLGAFVLLVAHLRSGILNSVTLPLSALMVVPALIGISIGFRYGDRFDQATFRRVTLFVLLIAGLNLIRRGLWG